MNNMKDIISELKRVQDTFENLESSKVKRGHRNRRYKDDTEWWILGKFKQILQNENIPFPNKASKNEQNDTDFVLENGISIQITEIVPKNLDEAEAWSKFVDVLNKKLLHEFGKNSWLLMYFDELYSNISDYGYWHNYILKRSQELLFSKCPYEKIFVINSSGEAAVSIYPYRFVIKPQWINKSTIIDECLFRYSPYYSK